MTPAAPTFFIAPFDTRGQSLPVSSRPRSGLATHWLEFWRQLLSMNGPVFRCKMPLPPLEHISLQFTSAEGAALVTFSAQNTPVSSAIALTGNNPAAESELLTMWVESLRRVRLVQQAAQSAAKPFQSAFALTQRPIYVFVHWPSSAVTAKDRGLVQELETHLAAAFLCGGTLPSS